MVKQLPEDCRSFVSVSAYGVHQLSWKVSTHTIKFGQDRLEACCQVEACCQAVLANSPKSRWRHVVRLEDIGWRHVVRFGWKHVVRLFCLSFVEFLP